MKLTLEQKRDLLTADLPQFIGSGSVTRNFTGLHYTEGVAYLAKTAGAYWLIDLIGSYQPRLRRATSQFHGPGGVTLQIWKLRVTPATATKSRRAVIICTEDYNEAQPDRFPALAKQRISYTDFPLETITLYVRDGVLMLRSES